MIHKALNPKYDIGCKGQEKKKENSVALGIVPM